jgi:hypothetical protein
MTTLELLIERLEGLHKLIEQTEYDSPAVDSHIVEDKRIIAKLTKMEASEDDSEDERI